MKRLLHKKGHIGKVGPGTRDVYSQDPETPKCLGGTRDWDPQSGTRGPKISKWNPGISIFYSFNRLFYTLHFTCYKTLHQFVYKINLFHGKYTDAAITMWCKFQRITSSYLKLSKILEKNCEGVPIYQVKWKTLSLQHHKCTPF